MAETAELQNVIAGWLPIATCPRDGSRFLAWDHIDSECFIVEFSNAIYRQFPDDLRSELVFYSDKHGWRESELSHWMPLPEGPK